MLNNRVRLLVYILGICILFTSSCGTPPEPKLVNGNESWLLKSVTFPDTVETSTGGSVRSTDNSHAVLYAEFECTTGKDLVSLWSGVDSSALANASMYLAAGFSDVYITNDSNEKYSVVLIEQCAVAGIVPKDGTGFILHFKDLEPLSLGN